MILTQLEEFRQAIYDCLGKVKDAVFELMRWSGFHFLQSPNRDMEIIRVEVIKPAGRNRKFKPLWLA
ncbi:hypothetical protein [Nostoc sp.]